MVQIIAEITWNCPAKCSFCPLRRTGLLDKGIIMPLEKYEKALKLFKRHFRNDHHEVVLGGGEPSIVPNLKQYVYTAKNIGYAVTVVTNAFDIENVIVSKPDAVEVSLDYWGRKHDEARGVPGLFNRTLRLIKEAVGHGILPVVRSTAVRDNIEDILKIKKWLVSNGLKQVPHVVMPVRGVADLKPTRQQLEELLRHNIILSNYCPAGISSFVLTPSMDVLACIFYRKKLGELREFSDTEMKKIVSAGKRLPRFPCEAVDK